MSRRTLAKARLNSFTRDKKTAVEDGEMNWKLSRSTRNERLTIEKGSRIRVKPLSNNKIIIVV